MAKPPFLGNQLNTKTINKGVAVALTPIPIIIKEVKNIVREVTLLRSIKPRVHRISPPKTTLFGPQRSERIPAIGARRPLSRPRKEAANEICV